MVAVHWRLAESNLKTDGFKNLEYYMETKEKHSFGRSWRIGKKMRPLVKHAYIYCKKTSCIYSVEVQVDTEIADVTFNHSTGKTLSHNKIDYGFRHDDGLPFFGEGGMAMHHKFYTDLSISKRFN
jgi:hypothetical protein